MITSILFPTFFLWSIGRGGRLPIDIIEEGHKSTTQSSKGTCCQNLGCKRLESDLPLVSSGKKCFGTLHAVSIVQYEYYNLGDEARTVM